jgi:hypothetical protein
VQHRSWHPDDPAVSVIVGTLLLILITVTAAAGLAIMVSEMQKNEMSRQSHIKQVENEKLLVTGISLGQRDDGSGTWQNITLDILNLNIDESTIIAASINDRYVRALADVGSDKPVPYLLDPENQRLMNRTGTGESSKINYLTVNATGNRKLRIDFLNNFSQPFHLEVGEPIRVKLITGYYNIFEKSFKPPNAVFKIDIRSEPFGQATRDVLVLDGSESNADGSVVRYEWTIWAGGTSPPQKASGKLVRVNNLSFAGDFSVNLTVTDDNGMKSTSGEMRIPWSTSFNPPSRVQLVDWSGWAVNNTSVVRVNVFSSSQPDPLKSVDLGYSLTSPLNVELLTLIGQTDPNTGIATIWLNRTGITPEPQAYLQVRAKYQAQDVTLSPNILVPP